ncbi:MAG TPA: hypothetical protein H9714_02645 [Candidatus Flavonifractor intestinipullorum]|uniref:SnoaL-like domain-containing protein n=1 Tax=Candidatus Flavonifractor intestinipullorum TaxID=2838587 RepID=A0A9D2S542_9FIRM|nr:hypothetical protein [Candidatus Flavonifractor intestinipullorum]
MSTKDIVDERRRLEYIVDHCKFETPEQVTELFEAYTHLIWKYKQVGRIYDFYYDGMMIHREGNNDLIGVDQVVKDTLACLAAFPDMEFKFYDIHGTGNPEEGFRFGQAVYFKGTFLGVSKYGQGTGAAFAPDECVDICECLVKRVDGKWRVVEEWGDRSTLAFERVLRQAAPFRTYQEAITVPDCAPEPEPAESDED